MFRVEIYVELEQNDSPYCAMVDVEYPEDAPPLLNNEKPVPPGKAYIRDGYSIYSFYNKNTKPQFVVKYHV